MFNVVEKHQKLVKGIMITITATFVVWGVSGYLGMAGDDGYVAKVGSNKIYAQDIDRAAEAAPEQAQDRMQVLFGLINRQLLLNSINDKQMTLTTKQLREAIVAIPLFQTDGSFDTHKYEEFLSQRYLTAAAFEKTISEQQLLQDYVAFFTNSYFISTRFESQFATLLSRQRHVSQYLIQPQQFYSKINISESEINAYYQQNMAKFSLAEQVKLHYIQLSVEQLAKAIKVSDAEVNKYLQDHPDASNEQVDVSHILFSVSSDASPQQKAAIKAQAEKVLAEVTANPERFAALAKQYSQDPGSADKGGDLGFFAKGVMVKPFEEVAFSLKPGQISDLVTTQYGFHILKLNTIKGNDLASKKQAAIAVIQQQQASAKLPSTIDKLNDIAYKQPDSLNQAAAQLGLTVQASAWLTKDNQQGLLANAKLQQAIFSPDVLQKRHNSEVIDMGNGTFIVARVSDYQPQVQKPLSEVKSQIVTALQAKLAAQMAAKQGQQDLLQIQQGKLKLNFSGNESVSLFGASTNKLLDQTATKQIFGVASDHLPAYVGAPSQTGAYVIYRINSQSIDNNMVNRNLDLIKNTSSQYAMMMLNAYVNALRSEYNVNYKLDRVKRNDTANSN